MVPGQLGQTVVPRAVLSRTRSPRAFSLVELLVAISIILILLSLMLPAMKRSIRQARATVCMHNLRSLDQILRMYRHDNHGWLPYVDPPDPDVETKDIPPAWFDMLVPGYVDDLAWLVCPDDPGATFLRVANPQRPPSEQERSASYGLSDFILSGPGGYLATGRHQPKRPQDTLLVADMGPDMVWNANGTPAPSTAGAKRGQARLSWTDGFDYGTTLPRYSWVTRRHSGAVNMLTMGGAVRRVRTEETMSRTIQAYYEQCAAGGCAFCLELDTAHYSFYHARTYWWTGPVPSP